MSYDRTEAVCPLCEKVIYLACDDYEIRNGDEMHPACAKKQDDDYYPTEAELTIYNGPQ